MEEASDLAPSRNFVLMRAVRDLAFDMGRRGGVGEGEGEGEGWRRGGGRGKEVADAAKRRRGEREKGYDVLHRIGKEEKGGGSRNSEQRLVGEQDDSG